MNDNIEDERNMNQHITNADFQLGKDDCRTSVNAKDNNDEDKKAKEGKGKGKE